MVRAGCCYPGDNRLRGSYTASVGKRGRAKNQARKPALEPLPAKADLGDWDIERAAAKRAAMTQLARSTTVQQMELAELTAQATVNARNSMEVELIDVRDASLARSEPKTEVVSQDTPTGVPLAPSVLDVRRGLRHSSELVAESLEALEAARSELHEWAKHAVRLGLPAADISEEAGVSRKTVYQWRERWG